MLLRMCPSLLSATDACAFCCFCCCCSVSAAAVAAVVDCNFVDDSKNDFSPPPLRSAASPPPPRRSRFLRDVSKEAERRTNDEVRHWWGWRRLLPDRVSDEDDGDDRSRAAASGYRVRDDKKNWRRGWIRCNLVLGATQFFFMAAANMCRTRRGAVLSRNSEYRNADARSTQTLTQSVVVVQYLEHCEAQWHSTYTLLQRSTNN
jgi:hypothetical protein